MYNVLEVTGLVKNYNNFRLEGITFNIQRGYIMGYIGPNGAGKTTTINLILGILNPDGGQIRLFGEDVETSPASLKERVGFVIGETAFYEFLSAKEMAGIIARFYKRWDWKAFDRYMKIFELDKNQKIESYSKGMKIKYMLACALSHNAELLLLDEPTSGLDPVFRSELMDIFQEIISDGEKSILFSTHITSDLDNIADYVTFINNGSIVFSDDKDSVLSRFSIVKGGRDQRENVMRTDKIVGILNSEVGFSALTNDREWFLRNPEKGVVLEKASLEDIMVHYVRGNKNAGLAV
ncbi:MAG TPA: ABC transporter ATP-binding protein [Clostridia bacterium]|nr:ABC transporter ATP-binding protein [Clostridia bacterium]